MRDAFADDTIVNEREIRRRDGGWLIPLGVLLALLGGVAIAFAFTATVATVLLFGGLLLVGGVAGLAQAFVDRGDDMAWEATHAALYLIAGGLILLDPVSGAIGLTLLLGAFFIFVGLTRISLGLRARRRHGVGGPFIAGGVLDLVLAGLIVLGWPATSAWVIGVMLGIELVFTGLSLVFVSLGLRRRDAHMLTQPYTGSE